MYEKGALIKASEINELKASVKAEMLRRNLTGSLAEYGGSAYDYTISPQSGGVIKTEHYAKILEPISKINTANLPSEDSANMPSLTTLNAELTTYKSYTGKSASTHGCMSSCSGLCYSACTSCSGCDGCTGCGGTCSYCTSCTGCSGCGSGCASSCDGCSGTCTSCDGCTGCTSCTGSCTGSCGNMCSSGCGGACSDSCGNACGGNCVGSCYNCTGSCEGSCTGSCTGTCSGCTGKFMF